MFKINDWFQQLFKIMVILTFVSKPAGAGGCPPRAPPPPSSAEAPVGSPSRLAHVSVFLDLDVLRLY